MNRRVFLQASAAFSMAAWADSARPTAIVKTTNGPVRGLSQAGVETFLGLRYAQPPLGLLRFRPPQKLNLWTGVVDADVLGAPSMQLRSGGSAVTFPGDVGKALGEVFTAADDIAKQNEDCLFLSVWTPQLGGSRKRPVMVWFHGGGFNYGSGSWPAYDGHNLASRHDVVVVTVNHRLNAFGYLYLGELLGEEYATSGNAGQQDLVAVLQWVRDNIAAFGGDPQNVTIFGQSGGGAKVSALLAMPAAKGLFHRAIVESGPGLRGIPKQAATETAKAILKALQVQPADLKSVPALDIAKAIAATPGLRFGPVVDSLALPAHPFDPVAPQQTANVPVMVGCTSDEQTLYQVGQPWWGKLTEAELAEKAKAAVGAKAPALIEAFKNLRPDDSPSYLYTDIGSATFAFLGSIRLAERKAALKAAPAYFYVFKWRSPVDGGILRAPHTMEIPFAFDNIAKGPLFLGHAPSTQKLADLVSKTWVAFARTGNPNHQGLPHWPGYEEGRRATMVFDVESKVIDDYEGQVRKILEA